VLQPLPYPIWFKKAFILESLEILLMQAFQAITATKKVLSSHSSKAPLEQKGNFFHFFD